MNNKKMKPEITFEKFLEIEKLLEIKWGYISSVERVPKSTKLLKLHVDFGEESTRTVVTNIGAEIENEQTLKHKMYPFVTNLVPSKIMGIESLAMIMPTTIDGKIIGDGSIGDGSITEFPLPGSSIL